MYIYIYIYIYIYKNVAIVDKAVVTLSAFSLVLRPIQPFSLQTSHVQ